MKAFEGIPSKAFCVALIVDLSDLDNAESFKNRETEDKYDTDRCNVLDYNGEQSFLFELVTLKFCFFNQGFRS